MGKLSISNCRFIFCCSLIFCALAVCSCSRDNEPEPASSSRVISDGPHQFAYREFEVSELESVIDQDRRHFILFVPLGHVLTSSISEGLLDLSEPLGVKDRKITSTHRVTIFRYRYAVSDISQFKGLLPNIYVPKEPYICLMRHKEEVSRAWFNTANLERIAIKLLTDDSKGQEKRSVKPL